MNRLLREVLIYNTSTYPYFNGNLKQVLDSHLEYLKNTGNRKYEPLNPEFRGKYIGDFYSVLNDLLIPPKYHRVIMLLNGLTNPIQYDGLGKAVFIPDLQLIEGILSVYNTGRGKLRLDEPGQ